MKHIIFLLLALLVAVPAAAGDRELSLYIWSEYIPDEVVQEFTKETGIKVKLSTYDSNEAMYAKLKLVGKGYDLVVPSSYFVSKMAREGMLLPLDKSKLTGMKNLMPRFTELDGDPGNKYSVPYLWGSTAIMVDTEQVPIIKVESLKGLWDDSLKGRLLLPNDPREVIGLALKAAGHSFNDVDDAHLNAAYESLKKLKPSVRVFDSDSPKQAILSGEVAVGVAWNGEAYIANSENPAIAYVYPQGGYSLWLDSLCIPAEAKNADEAHAFIDYILRPDVGARISSEMGYSTPNAEAVRLLPAEIRENRIIYPSEETLARGEFLDDLGDAVKKYDRIWTKLK